MATVTFRNLFKRFPDAQSGKPVTAVNDLNLEIRDGEFLVLVGPSGCGKTTALRMLAGLEEVSEGDIYIGERQVNDIEAGERDIAMVFQNYALYPHMSVYDNMAFGLRQRMLPPLIKRLTQPADTQAIRKDIDDRIDDAAEILGIKHLLNRKPKALSGGQRQRVALGRAIVRHPAVFLMDEPLSNLDAKLRVQTRAEIIKLHRRLGITTIYVTHDQIEAMTMGERIAVMQDGVLQQCDTPLTLYNQPANMFVAGFVGTPSMNFVEARVQSGNDGALMLDAGDFQIALSPMHETALRSRVGQEIIFGIRPEDIYAVARVPDDVEPSESIPMKVDVVEPTGNDSTLLMNCGAHTLTAVVNAKTRVREGETLEVVFDLAKIHSFDTETKQSLATREAAALTEAVAGS